MSLKDQFDQFRSKYSVEISVLRRYHWIFGLFLAGGVGLLGVGYLLGDVQWSRLFSIISLALGGTLISVSIVSLTVEFFGAMHLKNIVNLQEHYYEHGIFHICPHKDDECYKNHVDRLVNNASHVRILTVVGRRYTKPENVNQTKQLMEECDTFKLQILDFKSFHFDYHYDEFEPEEKNPDVTGRRSKEVFLKESKKLRSFANDLDNPDVEVRFFRKKPVFRLQFYDNYLFVGHYGLKTRGIRSPIMMYQVRSNSEIYEYFDEQFENYWNTDRDMGDPSEVHWEYGKNIPNRNIKS